MACARCVLDPAIFWGALGADHQRPVLVSTPPSANMTQESKKKKMHRCSASASAIGHCHVSQNVMCCGRWVTYCSQERLATLKAEEKSLEAGRAKIASLIAFRMRFAQDRQRRLRFCVWVQEQLEAVSVTHANLQQALQKARQ